jgi:nucleotide-binding universal stress UspA family protein
VAWTDVAAGTVPSGSRSASERLWDASLREAADLVVMGAFGHSRTRELIFGGCIQAALEAGDFPVLMLH